MRHGRHGRGRRGDGLAGDPAKASGAAIRSRTKRWAITSITSVHQRIAQAACKIAVSTATGTGCSHQDVAEILGNRANGLWKRGLLHRPHEQAARCQIDLTTPSPPSKPTSRAASDLEILTAELLAQGGRSEGIGAGATSSMRGGATATVGCARSNNATQPPDAFPLAVLQPVPARSGAGVAGLRCERRLLLPGLVSFARSLLTSDAVQPRAISSG